MSNQGGKQGSAPWPSDEEIEAKGWVKESRRDRRINSAPRAGQYYWVDFPHDAYEPEFVGEHPGIVIRGGKLTHGTCIVVPVTTRPQVEERYVHQLKVNPNPKGEKEGKVGYVICDHLYTVNICRLRPVIGLKGQVIYPRIESADFAHICELVQLALFPPQPAQKPAGTAEPAEKPAPAPPRDFNPESGRKILKLRGLRSSTEENH
jgi:uncharacterized protein YifN (PemK superfamily)